MMESRTCKRTLNALAAFSALMWLAGCGGGGFEKQSAPNQQNVKLVRSAFSSDAEAGAAKTDPLAARTEATWASLKVTVKLDGPAPAPQQLSVTRDQAVCQQGGKPLYDNAIEVGDGGLLGNVLVYLNTDLPADDSDEDEPLWVHSRYSMEKNPGLSVTEFDQKGCLFLSPVFAMRSNQTLKILNSDRLGHNTKLDAQKAAPLNDSVPANGFINYVPGAQERQPRGVSCSIHPWMKAFFISRDNPYFGVSDAEKDEFTIADIPAGVELEYRIWVVDQFADGGWATLKLDDAEVPMKRGGKVKLTLTPGTTHDLEVVVNSSAFSG